MFLANYSRKSLFKFWECVPALRGKLVIDIPKHISTTRSCYFTKSLLSGLPISTVIVWTQHEIFNISIAAISVKLLWSVLTSTQYPWKDCNFKGSSPDCYHEPKGEYNATCCTITHSKRSPNCTDEYYAATVFKYAAYDFYYKNQLALEHNPSLNSGRSMPLVYVGVTVGFYALGYIFLMMGLNRIRYILTPLSVMVCAIFFGPFLLFTLLYGDQDMYPSLPRDYQVFLNHEVSLKLSTAIF